jgi:hypothetical protein
VAWGGVAGVVACCGAGVALSCSGAGVVVEVAGAGTGAESCGAAAAGGGCEVLSFCAGAGAFDAVNSASDDADKRTLRLAHEEREPNMTKFLTRYSRFAAKNARPARVEDGASAPMSGDSPQRAALTKDRSSDVRKWAARAVETPPVAAQRGQGLIRSSDQSLGWQIPVAALAVSRPARSPLR